jgi:two-component system, cell cycle sensor histidine kinase and response regulator CckA
MGQTLAVLLVEDREDDADLIRRCLIRGGYDPQITRVETEGEFRGALAASRWDVILSEYTLADFNCQGALEALRSSEADIPFIALSGTVSEETILTLLHSGAGDYVMKNNMARLPSAVDRAIRETEGRRHRERLENQLQQAMKMEAIGRLAGGVAHDFNNLLTVIAGCAQLALLEDNPARSVLEEILLAADRASGLTRQLLAFSRQQSLEPQVFDINKLVRVMEKLLRRLIGEDILVVSRIAETPLSVKADPGQLEQVLLNLAINSRDAMPTGGKIILSTFRQRLDGSSATLQGLPAGDYCGISVSDNGTGISAEALPHIFEPFFTTKSEGTGTGLGLATAYGIVQQSCGAIHAQSEEGMGTTMTVLLPSSAVHAAALVSPAVETPDSGTETILIAEDDDTVLRLVSRSLSASGFQVIEADSGEAALERLHAQGPAGVDALITDVVMPGISGTVLAARATELLPQLKVLFMSGYTEDVIRHHGVLRENVAYLQKPFAPSELVRKIRQLLDPEKKTAMIGKV